MSRAFYRVKTDRIVQFCQNNVQNFRAFRLKLTPLLKERFRPLVECHSFAYLWSHFTIHIDFEKLWCRNGEHDRIKLCTSPFRILNFYLRCVALRNTVLIGKHGEKLFNLFSEIMPLTSFKCKHQYTLLRFCLKIEQLKILQTYVSPDHLTFWEM